MRIKYKIAPKILITSLLVLLISNLSITNAEIQTLDNPLPETTITILEIEGYPNPVFVNEVFYINLTIKNTGQFQSAVIENIKINVSVETGEKEIFLGGQIDSLGSGQEIEVKLNLILTDAGNANITLFLVGDNFPTVSASIDVEILDNSTTTVPFMLSSVFPIILFTHIFYRRRLFMSID